MNLRTFLSLLRITRSILAAHAEAVPTVDPIPPVDLAPSIDPTPNTTQAEDPSLANYEAAINETLPLIAAFPGSDEYCNKCRWTCYKATILTYV